MQPLRISRLLLAVAIALGILGSGFDAAAQASGGSALGWGDDSYGQVGDGTTGGACLCATSPLPVAGISTATEIAGGSIHSLALLSDGTVVSWGGNPWGQLGNGTPTLKATVHNGPVSRKIAGTGTLTPVAVPGLSNVVAVAAGTYHSLALLADGTVMAWGQNEYGELGIGNATGPETCETRPCARAPTPVPGLSDVIAISADGNVSLALLANGTVMAWGSNYGAQTGDGVGTPAGCVCVDHPVLVPGVTGAVAIAAGSDAEAALLATGAVETWGRNTSGELGDGSVIPGGVGCGCRGPAVVNALSAAKGVAMGGNFSFAVQQAGGAFSWGFNYFGELGNGTTGSGECLCVPVPGPVSAPQDLGPIAAAGDHALGLLPAGEVMSWGGNEEGQLGHGTTGAGSGLPATVGGLAGASAVGVGSASSFAIVGPSQTLDVALAGAGSGSVGTAGLLCPGACSARYPQSQVEALRAEPAPGSGFAGFSGPCTGTGACRVKMEADQHVTATFGPPKGTAITKSTISRAKRRATFAFAAPGAITGFECALIKPGKKKKKKHRGHHRKRDLRAGAKKPKPSFSACASPKSYKHLKAGTYTFEVRALDILGADATPAAQKFKLKKPKKKHHRHKR